MPPAPWMDPLEELARRAVEHAVAVLVPDVETAEASAAVAAAGDALRSARATLAAALNGGDALLQTVAQRAGLDLAETELLAVLLGAEQHEDLQRLLVALTGDRDRHRVELWMLAHLLPGSTPAVVGPGSALRRSALVELVPRGAFGRTTLTLAPRLLWALWGDTRPDPALPVSAALVYRSPDEAPDQAVDQAVDAGAPAVLDAVLVVGGDRVRRRQRAMAALGVDAALVCAVPSGALGSAGATEPDQAAGPGSYEAWAALVREATLSGAALLVEPDGDLDETARRWLEAATHLPVAVCSTSGLRLDDLPPRAWRELAPAGPAITRAEWQAVAGPAADQPHALTAEQLDRMRRALVLSGGDADVAYRRLTDARIETLASRVVPRAGWDDLVLAPARKQRLRELVDRYRSASVVYDDWGLRPSPSRGLVALFSGKSGTGKSMSAEVVAGELGLDMYRLDLSAVVSKYIGETEKNLDQLFDAASIGGTVLFFDEADAMFGKRTEVSDAHDRYANVGTSYLLQRLERYDGIVVLATNYEKNIDEAFLRRVHIRLDFPLPGPAERELLWRHHLASGLPVADDVDVDWLVRALELSGAGIKNSVFDAAFLAARDHTAVTMAHLVRGAAREMGKSSLRITRDRFGPWFDVVDGVG